MTWRIGEILVQKKWISWEQLHEALEEQERTKELLGTILVRKGYLSEFLFHKALAEQFGMRFVDLTRIRINPKAVEIIHQSIAQKYQIMPIELLHNFMIIGIASPIHTWPEEEIRQMAGVSEIQTVLCVPSAIEKATQENYDQAEITTES